MVLGGETDTGKTLQSLKFGEDSDRIRVLDTEDRVQRTIEFFNIERDIDVVKVLQTFKKTDHKAGHIKYQPDYLASYDELRKQIIDSIDNSVDYDILIIDGVSPIRTQYCRANWFRDNTGRINPTQFEWGDINEYQRKLLEPLIHLSRNENKTVIFTAQMADAYKNGNMIGRQLDMRDWGSYNVDYIIELYRPFDDDNRVVDGEYYAKCSKSILGAWTEDMSNNRLLYDVFLEYGI
jgi:hypothetical protein